MNKCRKKHGANRLTDVGLPLIFKKKKKIQNTVFVSCSKAKQTK